MAIYNEILAGRFARAVQKLFSMKGGPPMRQLAGELAPAIQLDNMMALEHRALLSVRAFSRSTSVAAGGAGNRSAWRLRNPVGSNVLAIVEKVCVVGSAAADLPFVNRGPTGTGDLTTIDTANVSIRDLRLGATSGSLIASQSGAAAVVGTQWLLMGVGINAQSDGILVPNQEFVIAPGDLITIYGNNLNQALNFTIMWRERPMEESETTL